MIFHWEGARGRPRSPWATRGGTTKTGDAAGVGAGAASAATMRTTVTRNPPRAAEGIAADRKMATTARSAGPDPAARSDARAEDATRGDATRTGGIAGVARTRARRSADAGGAVPRPRRRHPRPHPRPPHPTTVLGEEVVIRRTRRRTTPRSTTRSSPPSPRSPTASRTRRACGTSHTHTGTPTTAPR